MIKIAFCTVDSLDTARSLSQALVGERLAACVNIVPGVTSVYKWQGEVEEASELLLIIKTSPKRVEDLTRRIAELHPYDVPEVISIPVDGGLPSYLDWVLSETSRT